MSIIGNNFFNYKFEPQILKKKDDTEEESVKVPEIEEDDGLLQRTVEDGQGNIVPVTDIPVDTLIACTKLNIEKQESEKPTLDEVIKQMGLRSTNCKGVYCQKHNPDMPEGNNTHLKHYVWNSATHEMVELKDIYYIDSSGRQARGLEGYGLILAQMQGFTPQEDGTFVKANIVYTFDSAKNRFVVYEPKPEDTSVMSTDSVDTTAPATEENLQAELAKAKENLAKAQKALQENTDETKTEELHKALSDAMDAYTKVIDKMVDEGQLTVRQPQAPSRAAMRPIAVAYLNLNLNDALNETVEEFYDEDTGELYKRVTTKYAEDGETVTDKTEEYFDPETGNPLMRVTKEYSNGQLKTETNEYFRSSYFELGSDGSSKIHYPYRNVKEYDANGQIKKTITEYFEESGNTVCTYEYDSNGQLKTKTDDTFKADGGKTHSVSIYNENGQHTTTREYINPDGTRSAIIYQVYHSNGHISTEIIYGKKVLLDGMERNYCRVEKYGESNNLITKTEEYYDADGNCVRKVTVERDGTTITETLKDGLYTKTTETKNEDGSFSIVVESVYDTGSKTVETREFDSNGKLKSRTIRYSIVTGENPAIDGIKTEDTGYRYDENGVDNITGKQKEEVSNNAAAEYEQKANGFIADFKAEKYTLDTAMKYLSEIGATVKETRTEGNKTIITFTLDGIEYAAEAVLYDKDGFDCLGFDRQGYDKEGFNADGINRKGQTKNQVKAETFVKDFKSGKYSYNDAVNYLKSIGAKNISSEIKLFGLSRVLTFNINGTTYTTQCSLIKLTLALLQNIFR